MTTKPPGSLLSTLFPEGGDVTTLDLDSLVLGHGSHESPEAGMCVMEAVAFMAGESFSDSPECASPVISSFLRSWNDSLGDDDRQMLKPYIPRLIGTKTTPEDEETRAWMATDWLARECAPAFMRLAGLTGQAELVERLAPITSTEAARTAQPTLDGAKKASTAAWAAAAAASAGARAATASAGAAARAATASAGAAARAASRDVAWDVAWAGSRAAAAATWAAAGDALSPTVKALQVSALGLLDRMIEVGKA